MKWRPTDHLAWQMIGGEAVLIDLRSGTALGLNRTGSLIWSLLADNNDTEISAELARQFDIDAKTADKDVREFTTLLQSRGLLIEST